MEEDHRDKLDQMELNLLGESQETNYQVKSKSVFIIKPEPEPETSKRRESHNRMGKMMRRYSKMLSVEFQASESPKKSTL